MEKLLIDRTKLKTAKSFAEMRGFSLVYVYRMIKEKKVNTTKIDGVTFIVV